MRSLTPRRQPNLGETGEYHMNGTECGYLHMLTWGLNQSSARARNMKFSANRKGGRDSPKNRDGHPISLWAKSERHYHPATKLTSFPLLTLKIPLHPSLFQTPLKSRTALRPVEASSAPRWSRVFATSIGVQMTPETNSAVSPESKYTGAC